jgi:hypothetical protein
VYCRYKNIDENWWKEEIKTNKEFSKWLKKKEIKESGKTFDQ